MEHYGRFIFFDKNTGKVLLITVERYGGVPLSANDIVLNDENLSALDTNSYDYIQLEYGQFAQDFVECSSFRVNPQTKEIEFSYPDSEQPPMYQKPMSEQIKSLERQQKQTNDDLSSLMDFIITGGM